MSRELPKIAKDAQRVRAAIEVMFTRMARRHKYTTGADLRAAAKCVVVGTLRVWRSREEKVELARELVAAVDLLKLELQLGAEIQAFGRWAEFEAAVRLVEDVSQQSGWWLKSLQGSGQNAPSPRSAAQRAPTLSSRSASTNEAIP